MRIPMEVAWLVAGDTATRLVKDCALANQTSETRKSKSMWEPSSQAHKMPLEA